MLSCERTEKETMKINKRKLKGSSQYNQIQQQEWKTQRKIKNEQKKKMQENVEFFFINFFFLLFIYMSV